MKLIKILIIVLFSFILLNSCDKSKAHKLQTSVIEKVNLWHFRSSNVVTKFNHLKTTSTFYVGVGTDLYDSIQKSNQDIGSNDYIMQKIIPVRNMSIEFGYYFHNINVWSHVIHSGLQYTYMTPQKITGDIDDYGRGNYTYSYIVQRQLFSLISHLDLFHFGPIVQYFELGLGVMNSKAHSYHEYDNRGDIRHSSNFANKSAKQAVYSVGLGLNYKMYQHLILSLEYYNYIHDTRISLGKSTQFPINKSLITNFNDNNIKFSMNYQFG